METYEKILAKLRTVDKDSLEFYILLWCLFQTFDVEIKYAYGSDLINTINKIMTEINKD